ncbi:MAG: hypothetical protein RI969_1571 [Verrucomicrobiota bacterium]
MLWTWKSDDLRDLEKSLARLEAVKPKETRIALGLYLWDYTGIDETKKADPTYRFGKPTPPDLMELQCGLGLKWLKEGRVCDLVVLGNTHLDIGAPSAPLDAPVDHAARRRKARPLRPSFSYSALSLSDSITRRFLL